MTEPTDRSSLEARLRATLATAAPADTHLDAGLADLRGRLDGSVVPLARARRPRSSRLLLVAAAVVAVAAIGAGVVLVGGDDAPTNVTTDDGTTTVGGPDAPGPPADWYVPVGLPDGWTLDSVSTDYRDVEGYGGTCPCLRRAWVAPDGVAEVSLTSVPQAGPLGDVGSLVGDAAPVDLGGGIEGQAGTAPTFGLPVDDIAPALVVIWVDDGSRWYLRAHDLTSDEVLAAAQRLAAEPTDVPADGWDVVVDSTVPAGVGSFDSVEVGLRGPSGVVVGYQLFPPGYSDPFVGVVGPERLQLEGQVERLWRYDFPAYGTLPSEQVPAQTVLAGEWTGADVVLGASSQGGEAVSTDTPAFDDLLVLAAALRPATAAEWSAFLDTAPDGEEHVGADVPRTGSVADLTRPDEPNGN